MANQCKKCYAYNEPGAKFCGTCGNNMGVVSSPPVLRTPQKPVQRGFTPPAKQIKQTPGRSLLSQQSYSMKKTLMDMEKGYDMKKTLIDQQQKVDMSRTLIDDEKGFDMGKTLLRDEAVFDMDTQPQEADFSPVEDRKFVEDKSYELQPEDIPDTKSYELPSQNIEVNFLDNIFGKNRNLAEAFVISEIFSPPKSRR